MQYTRNLELNKPELNDYADIAALNENMDKLDAAVAGKVDADGLAVAVKALAQSGDLTAADLGAVDADTVGQPGGVAQLGEDGKLVPAQAPDTGAVTPVTGVPETVEHNRIAVDEAGVAYTGTTASAPVMQYSTANITISDAEPAETLPEGHIWMVYS